MSPAPPSAAGSGGGSSNTHTHTRGRPPRAHAPSSSRLVSSATTKTSATQSTNAHQLWAFAKARLRAIMANAAISRRFINASALAICAFSAFPVIEPTSNLSLSLANGNDSVPLPHDDAFAVNVRRVAARAGVKHPELINIRVGEETSGASMGANLTIRSRGACIVLPAELCEAFHASAELRSRFDIPAKEEIDFVLAHESAHIARNHSLISGSFLPLSLVGCCYAIKKVPNKLVAAVVGCVGLVVSNTYLSWHLEHEADHVAAEAGFAKGGINCFERKLSRNCELRTLLGTRMITKKGNYLGDTAHPLLTSRIDHLKLIADGSHKLHTTPVGALFGGSSCKFCLALHA